MVVVAHVTHIFDHMDKDHILVIYPDYYQHQTTATYMPQILPFKFDMSSDFLAGGHLSHSGNLQCMPILNQYIPLKNCFRGISMIFF